MMHAAANALAVPHLSPAIPLKFLISGEDSMVAPLSIALLEADVITTRMLRPPRDAKLVDVFSDTDARELSMRALSKWWDGRVKANSCKFFRWKLHVQRLENVYPENDDVAWFIFTRMEEFEMPRFALARRVEQLEVKLPGFGQTVLAVLRDATLYLPDSFTPWQAVGFAEYMHWGDSSNDAELLEDYRVMNGYETIQEVIDNDGVLTRAKFYEHIPEWVTAPRRLVSRVDIGHLPLTQFEMKVVAACDAIAALVSRQRFTLRPSDKGAYRAGNDTVDGSMVLLWRDGDVISQVIDDGINHLWEGGECNEFIDANPVPMTVAGIHEFQNLTEQMMQLAVLTERLVLLIGERL